MVREYCIIIHNSICQQMIVRRQMSVHDTYTDSIYVQSYANSTFVALKKDGFC